LRSINSVHDLGHHQKLPITPERKKTGELSDPLLSPKTIKEDQKQNKISNTFGKFQSKIFTTFKRHNKRVFNTI